MRRILGDPVPCRHIHCTARHHIVLPSGAGKLTTCVQAANDGDALIACLKQAALQ
ncbi:MAG: hypothetical protein ACXVW5_30010 [Solirubrobacteraceae bacterium]